MDILTRVIRILRETLMLTDHAAELDANTPILGSLPGFDSVAVVSVLTALEQEFGIVVHDDEMSADVFETVGSLERFVRDKLAG